MTRTSLWLLMGLGRRRASAVIGLKPEIDTWGLVLPSINPNRLRKGKSGELPRRRGRW